MSPNDGVWSDLKACAMPLPKTSGGTWAHFVEIVSVSVGAPHTAQESITSFETPWSLWRMQGGFTRRVSLFFSATRGAVSVLFAESKFLESWRLRKYLRDAIATVGLVALWNVVVLVS